MSYGNAGEFEVAMLEHMVITEEETARLTHIEDIARLIGPMAAEAGVEANNVIATPGYVTDEAPAGRPWGRRDEQQPRGRVMYKEEGQLEGWTIHEEAYDPRRGEKLSDNGDITERVILTNTGTLVVARSKTLLAPSTKLVVPKPIKRDERGEDYDKIKHVYAETRMHALVTAQNQPKLARGELLGPRTTLDTVVEGIMKFTVDNDLDKNIRRR